MVIVQEKGCWRKAVLLTAVIVAVYLFIASQTTLWDRDEARFARAAAEMAQSGNFLYPTFNGEVRAHKPAGVYWFMALGIKIFGMNAFGARFFSAIATGGVLLLIYRAGTLLAGCRAGLWAMAVMATAAMTPIFGSAATADAVLMFFMMGVMAVFVRQVTEKPHFYDIPLMAGALGMALLVKGPVGLLAIAVIWLSLLLGKKTIQNRQRIFLFSLASLVIAVVLFLAWAIPANHATDGAFFEFGFMNQFVNRIMHPMEDHGGNFWAFLPFYPGILFVGFFPWTLLLIAAIRSVWKDSPESSPIRVVLFTWMISVIVIMTMVATKLPHYILFTWPAFSLAVGFFIAKYESEPAGQGPIRMRKTSFRLGLGLFLPITVLLSPVLLIGPWFAPLETPIQVFAVIAGLILLVMMLFAGVQTWKLQVRRAAVCLVAGIFLLYIPLCVGILPLIDHWKITPRLVEIIKEKTPPDAEIAAYRYVEPSMNFYLNKPVEEIFEGEEGMFRWSYRPGVGYIVVPQATLDESNTKRIFPADRIENIGTVKGFNFAWGQEMTVHVLKRNGDE